MLGLMEQQVHAGSRAIITAYVLNISLYGFVYEPHFNTINIKINSGTE